MAFPGPSQWPLHRPSCNSSSRSPSFGRKGWSPATSCQAELLTVKMCMSTQSRLSCQKCSPSCSYHQLSLGLWNGNRFIISVRRRQPKHLWFQRMLVGREDHNLIVWVKCLRSDQVLFLLVNWCFYWVFWWVYPTGTDDNGIWIWGILQLCQIKNVNPGFIYTLW